jgi:hypothetical protein
VSAKLKPRARVVAEFDISAKAAPHLEALLRAIPEQISCTVLKVTTHGEQVPQPGREPVQSEGRGGREQQGIGLSSGAVDARKDGLVARVARKVTGKK